MIASDQAQRTATGCFPGELYQCFRFVVYVNQIMFRYSTGWKCGLHPDWTELTGCVDHYMRFTEPGPVSENRRYFYISFLRDPVSRYLSEWRHVARGATWDGAELKCGGVEWGQRLPRCWGSRRTGRGWS